MRLDIFPWHPIITGETLEGSSQCHGASYKIDMDSITSDVWWESWRHFRSSHQARVR